MIQNAWSIVGGGSMFFEDESGKILTPEEVDKLSLREILDRNLHVFDEDY